MLRERGIHKFYYCLCPDLIKLEIYRQDGIPNEKRQYTSVAQLFHLDISSNYKSPSSWDLFNKERYVLEDMIRDRLKMCSH